ARAGDALECVHLVLRDLAGRVGADDLEHVLDRHVVAAVTPRGDGAAVEHEPRQVEPGERHHSGRDRLVAPDEADETVEQMAAGGRGGDAVGQRRTVALGRARLAVDAHEIAAPSGATASGSTCVSAGSTRRRSSATRAEASFRAQTTTDGPEPESVTPTAPGR